MTPPPAAVRSDVDETSPQGMRRGHRRSASSRLTHVQLRFGPTGEELARYNVHESDGGGKFTLISGEEHREELGAHWELAYNHLRPRPFDTPKRQRAWGYLEGSLPYHQKLQEPPRSGLFGT